MSDISKYLADNANAGACAANYYGNTHDTAQCRLAAGVCSVIAYLVMELKNAERQARLALQAQPIPTYVPPAPIPPVSTGGTNVANLGHSSDLATWNDGVEKR